MNDFIPPKDADLGPWLANFQTLITATPTTYGLTSGQATTNGTLVTAWNSAYTAATNPTTRTSVTVAAKDAARSAVVANVRYLVVIIQSTITVTPAQKTALGITPRDATRTPVPAPTVPPTAVLTSLPGRQIELRVSDPSLVKPSNKPAGVVGHGTYFAVGSSAPATFADYTFLRFQQRNIEVIDLATFPVGSTVWVTSTWQTRKGLQGPNSTPHSQILAA